MPIKEVFQTVIQVKLFFTNVLPSLVIEIENVPMLLITIHSEIRARERIATIMGIEDRVIVRKSKPVAYCHQLFPSCFRNWDDRIGDFRRIKDWVYEEFEMMFKAGESGKIIKFILE